MKRTVALATLLLTCCSPSAAEPELRLSDPWAREMVAGQSTTAAYVTIVNEGGADRLMAVSAPQPARTSLHITSYDNGIARMRPVEDGLEIPAEATVVLRPGGPHIMVEQLAGPLTAGESLRLTLRFERSGERSLELPVRNSTAPAPPHQAN